MRSLAVLIAALCLVLTSPVMALEEEDRMLQVEDPEDYGIDGVSGMPSMEPLMDSDMPSMEPALGGPGDSGTTSETFMPTAEATSGSFKTATAVAGAATLCAFAGLS